MDERHGTRALRLPAALIAWKPASSELTQLITRFTRHLLVKLHRAVLRSNGWRIFQHAHLSTRAAFHSTRCFPQYALLSTARAAFHSTRCFPQHALLSTTGNFVVPFPLWIPYHKRAPRDTAGV
eukprot:IDg10550t1